MEKSKKSDNRKAKKNSILDTITNKYNSIVVPSRLEITSNREVFIDGCRELLEYSDTSVKINMGKLIVSFTGRGLTIKSMTNTSLIILGYISHIEFIT